MPLGDVAIIEVVLRQLGHFGFGDVTLAVGHLAELLMAYCADGTKFGVKIRYSREDTPLGTAGPIAMVKDLDDTFLVMNGDLLTTTDYGAMLRFHRERGALATVATFERPVPIDLGVLKLDEASNVIDYVEKPILHYWVSMGVYLFEPGVLRFLPPMRRFDLPDLILTMLRANERVVAYPHTGYWLDIGRPDDYEAAVREFEQRRSEFLPERS
jgi:NDP-sugar pyrophosphorylase family protein